MVGIFQNKIGRNLKLSSLILRSCSQEYIRNKIFVKLNLSVEYSGDDEMRITNPTQR